MRTRDLESILKTLVDRAIEFAIYNLEKDKLVAYIAYARSTSLGAFCKLYRVVKKTYMVIPVLTLVHY